MNDLVSNDQAPILSAARFRWTRVAAWACVVGATVLPWSVIENPEHARAAAIACGCLMLWLTEVIPLFATTLLFLAGVTLALGPLDPSRYGLSRVLAWSANPVMALFFGGFALSLAAISSGLDRVLAARMMMWSRGRRRRLLAAVMLGTALLSMWISNIAAAAMMVVTLRPVLGSAEEAETRGDAEFRRAVLLGIAFAANFGGMATPIGSGPNLIAIGAVAPLYRITFSHWMMFGLPLTVLMLAVTFVLLVWLHRVEGPFQLARLAIPRMSRDATAVAGLLLLAATLWMTEPFHGLPAGAVALGLAGVLFASRLLSPLDLRRIEWDTLMLIAGGLALGELLDKSGLAQAMAGAMRWRALPDVWFLLAFVLACALFAAVASNTAASAMFIQIGLGITPTPAFAVIVALGASMGVPFVISTPPNAIAYGQGGIRPRDLLIPGLLLMAGGCVLLALTGRTVLRWVQMP